MAFRGSEEAKIAHRTSPGKPVLMSSVYHLLKTEFPPLGGGPSLTHQGENCGRYDLRVISC